MSYGNRNRNDDYYSPSGDQGRSSREPPRGGPSSYANGYSRDDSRAQSWAQYDRNLAREEDRARQVLGSRDVYRSPERQFARPPQSVRQYEDQLSVLTATSPRMDWQTGRYVHQPVSRQQHQTNLAVLEASRPRLVSQTAQYQVASSAVPRGPTFSPGPRQGYPTDPSSRDRYQGSGQPSGSYGLNGHRSSTWSNSSPPGRGPQYSGYGGGRASSYQDDRARYDEQWRRS